MSNFYFPPMEHGHGHPADSQSRVQNWMLAQMAQYPPPPQADAQHYNALYPAPPGQQQLLDGQEQLSFSSINQPLYPKTDAGPSEQGPSNQQIHNLAHDLQQHTSLGDQQRHLAQAAQHIQQQHTPHSTPAGSHHPSALDQTQKPNRLRKACDSCSIRKVKVSFEIYMSCSRAYERANSLGV